MSSTVPCPECRQPARVLESFIVERAGGPVRYLRLQCEGPLSFLVTVEEVDENVVEDVGEANPALRPDLEIDDGAA